MPQYEKAEIRRTQEAAVLKLRTYSWTFDIVPCFFTAEDEPGNTYYIIPDGLGHWKKTDPRKDANAISAVNNHFDGNVLNPLRVLKFWNSRVTAPVMSSYLLETIIVTYYLLSHESKSVSSFVDLEIPDLLAHIKSALSQPVYDLKGIQGDLNKMSYDERQKIEKRATLDYRRAVEARAAERNDDHKTSIAKWTEVFGPKFSPLWSK